MIIILIIIIIIITAENDVGSSKSFTYAISSLQISLLSFPENFTKMRPSTIASNNL